jgi:hypothetical protein
MNHERGGWSVRYDHDIDEWEVVRGNDVYATSENKGRAERIAAMMNVTRPSDIDPTEALNRIAPLLTQIAKRAQERGGNNDLVRLARNALKFIGPSRSTERNRKRRRERAERKARET